MIHPSGIKTPEDLKLKIKQVKKGLYVVENAYEGEVTYFPDKSVEANVETIDENQDKTEKNTVSNK